MSFGQSSRYPKISETTTKKFGLSEPNNQIMPYKIIIYLFLKFLVFLPAENFLRFQFSKAELFQAKLFENNISTNSLIVSLRIVEFP
jgi:hypothetical protein